MDSMVYFFLVNKDKIKMLLTENKTTNTIIIKGEISNIASAINKSIIIINIINYFIMVFSWYYISCFNNVYPNIKIEWIKSSIFIYLLNEILSFVYILGYTLLRYISIKYKSEKCFKLMMKLI